MTGQCRPFYKPRELTIVILAAVYIPPDVNVSIALSQLHATIDRPIQRELLLLRKKHIRPCWFKPEASLQSIILPSPGYVRPSFTTPDVCIHPPQKEIQACHKEHKNLSRRRSLPASRLLWVHGVEHIWTSWSTGALSLLCSTQRAALTTLQCWSTSGSTAIKNHGWLQMLTLLKTQNLAFKSGDRDLYSVARAELLRARPDEPYGQSRTQGP